MTLAAAQVHRSGCGEQSEDADCRDGRKETDGDGKKGVEHGGFRTTACLDSTSWKVDGNLETFYVMKAVVKTTVNQI